MATEPKAGLYQNAQSASYLPPTSNPGILLLQELNSFKIINDKKLTFWHLYTNFDLQGHPYRFFIL